MRDAASAPSPAASASSRALGARARCGRRPELLKRTSGRVHMTGRATAWLIAHRAANAPRVDANPAAHSIAASHAAERIDLR